MNEAHDSRGAMTGRRQAFKAALSALVSLAAAIAATNGADVPPWQPNTDTVPAKASATVVPRPLRAETIYRIRLSAADTATVADVMVRAAGHTHLGVSHFTLPDRTGLVHGQDGLGGGGAWDCREWQWWRGYPGGAEMRPRSAPATCGLDVTSERVRVSTAWISDGVHTSEQWFFRRQPGPAELHYDCVVTVENRTGHALQEYGQFFASYTSLNAKNGHWYWDASDRLVNFRDIGGNHIDRFIVERDDPFAALGQIPHCPRGEGKVSGYWRHPVLVSHPAVNGLRHIIMGEPRTTAGITMGMAGIAMDYIVYPGGAGFGPGETFRTHVRHYIAALPAGREVETLERLWSEFQSARERVHAWARVSP